MIIYCGLDGKVASVPSTVPMGTILDDVVIITPQANVTATLRVKPAYQSYLPEIICSPVINEDHAVAFRGKIEKNVTGTAGRAEYQVILTDQNGKAVASYAGSFNVSRGIMVDMPEDAEDLQSYSLEQIYTMLSNVTTVYNMLVNVENVIGIPNEELQTAQKTLISAINDLHRKANLLQSEIGTGTLYEHRPAAGESGIIGAVNANRKSIDANTTEIERNSEDIDTLEKMVAEHGDILATPFKTDQIADKAITTEKMQDRAVTHEKLASGSVTNEKLGSGPASRIIHLEDESFTDATYDPENGVLTFTSTNGKKTSIDLPLELIISGGEYDEENQDLVLMLASGDRISIPLDDLTANVIDYVNGVRDSIFVLQKAPPLSSLTDAVLLPSPTLSAVAGLN